MTRPLPVRPPAPLPPLLAVFTPDEIAGLRWQDQASCAQADPEAFFPEKGGSTRVPKLICAACPVRAECLTFALDHRERFGIYGGLSERERHRLEAVYGSDTAAAVASVIPRPRKALAA